MRETLMPQHIRHTLFVLLFCLLCAKTAFAQEAKRYPLEYKPAPIDNPLKGLVPYQAEVRDFFPHSMEFNYIAFADLMKGWDKYDWTPLEKMLEDIASRGHHAVFRIYLEYPGQTNVIPQFLLNTGLKVHRYLNTNTQPFPPQKVETPDYNDPNLRKALTSFIYALGKKYDGDRRIGYITAGLLGTWGEWHTYPREELFASKSVQEEVMTAYAQAFKTTPILLRYPAGERDPQYSSTVKHPFGYHDDSFAWATLDTGKPSDSWFYIPRLKGAGNSALEIWKRHPIGGEIRPEAWGFVFDEKHGKAEIQNFVECVTQTHATWLMDSGMFQKKQDEARIARAKEQVRRMGYEYCISAITLNPKPQTRLDFEMEIVNNGVAPFYYDWGVEFALLMENNKILTEIRRPGKLKGILPNKPQRWRVSWDITGFPKGTYKLALLVPNPLPSGKGQPLRFANKTQDADRTGYVTLHEKIVIE
jgi:hypothetical protein